MTTRKLLPIAALTLGLGLAACSDDSKDTVHNVRAAPELQGTFADACSSSKLLDMSEQIQLKFDGNNYTRSQVYFSDADCKQELGRVEYAGEFLAGEEGASAERPDGTLDLKVNEAIIKISGEGLAKTFNAMNFCGRSDYTVGKDVSLTGEQTDGLCPIENIPTNRYTYYRLNEGNLVLSDSDITTMSKDAAQRSVTPNTERIYTKN